MTDNPVGLDGMEFIEYTGPSATLFENLFEKLGMKAIAKHKTKDITLYRQNQINFLLNQEPGSFAENFQKLHGPSVCSTGFRVFDSKKAFETAVKRGARPFGSPKAEKESFEDKPFGEKALKSLACPAVYGVGDSLIYFVDRYGNEGNIYDGDFHYTTENKNPEGKGFLLIDHLTNNVPKGEMDFWAGFYEKIFNFREFRYFDIKGANTGLLSRAMRSPCGKITIPINEPTEEKSQIQEYIEEYKGSGVQHIALLTKDICSSVRKIRETGIKTLEVPDTYYEVLKDRVPHITESMEELKGLKILADGDPKGYLLQIFTQNVIGPIFYEFIQRKNHSGFGEGNFQALFEAIERDQKRRGVL